jgi:hypothetical protein
MVLDDWEQRKSSVARTTQPQYLSYGTLYILKHISLLNGHSRPGAQSLSGNCSRPFIDACFTRSDPVILTFPNLPQEWSTASVITETQTDESLTSIKSGLVSFFLVLLFHPAHLQPPQPPLQPQASSTFLSLQTLTNTKVQDALHQVYLHCHLPRRRR